MLNSQHALISHLLYSTDARLFGVSEEPRLVTRSANKRLVIHSLAAMRDFGTLVVNGRQGPVDLGTSDQPWSAIIWGSGSTDITNQSLPHQFSHSLTSTVSPAIFG